MQNALIGKTKLKLLLLQHSFLSEHLASLQQAWMSLSVSLPLLLSTVGEF